MATIEAQIVAAAVAELKLRDNAGAESQAYSILPQIHEEVIMNYRFPWAVKFFNLVETAASRAAEDGAPETAAARPLGTYFRVFKWPLDCLGHPEIFFRINGSWTAQKMDQIQRVGNELHIPSAWLSTDEFIMRGIYLIPINDACAGAAGGAIYQRVLELGVAARVAPNFDQGLAVEKNNEFMAAALRCRSGSGLQQETRRRGYFAGRNQGAIFHPGDASEPFAQFWGGTIAYGTGPFPPAGPDIPFTGNGS